jgi:8-oxo-dGTP diphosphatase
MENFRIAVKAFIINDEGKLLLIKRRSNDVHAAGVWEIPGGRLDLGEDPFAGLKRETKEETNLDIEVMNPLKIDHFTREDGQKITMLIFLCKPLSNKIKLSEEHTDFVWEELNKAKEKLHKAFHKDIDIFNKYFSKS